MPSQVLGSTQYTYFNAYGSGDDIVSEFSFPSTDAPLTGSLSATTLRPIRVNSFSVYFRSTSSGNVQLQLADNTSGGGGYQSGTVSATGTQTVDPGFAKFVGDTVYYGLQKTDGGEVRIWRGGTSNGGLWREGTKLTDYPSAGMYAAIEWQVVPNQPTSVASSSVTRTGLTLSWTAPTSNGGAAINGYRILYKASSSPTWLVAVADTGSATTSSAITGLTAGTSYDFRVAALNAVTDAHNGTYTSTGAHTGTNSTTFTVSTAAPVIPVWTDNTLATFYEDVVYADAVSATNATSYSVSAGTLPAGISFNTTTGAVTGTPTTLGAYDFTLRAVNDDGAITQQFVGEVINASAGAGIVRVRTADDWVEGTLHVYDGTDWNAASVFVYNGTEWVESA